jgi:hypothetical protein
MKLLIVTLGFRGKQLDIEVLRQTFASVSWARISPNVWIIHTTDTPKTWADKLRLLCGPSDSIFVSELADNDSGWLPQDIWDWIKARRSST